MEEKTNGFYQLDENNNLLFAPNAIYSKDYTLVIEEKDSYEYPNNGWYYFESREEALTFFNIEEKSNG